MSDTPTVIRSAEVPTCEREAANVTVSQSHDSEKEPLSNHPLWPAFLAELEANRRADSERDAAEYAE